jgi:DNA-binding NtrC family response regulator
MAQARILLVEDEANMVRTLAKILDRKGYTVDAAPNGQAALAHLAEHPVDVVITDLNMPVMDGMQLMRAMHERGFTPVIIVLTGHGTIQSAVEAMKLGASDYLIKPCNPDELVIVVERQLETRKLRREVVDLRQRLKRYDRFGEIVGKAPAMRAIYQLIDAVSRNKSNVLLFGENGTGKELVARTIHGKSALAERPFLAVNCGALAETLLESQLFGHKRGAFTGAVEDHEGVFQAAHGGTLFLDEISEIPMPLQVKFLRAIQEKEVTPLGSTKAVQVDVRIIAATNRDLETALNDGTFRSDLYYRLNVVSIHLPPLRDRPEDIPLLIAHFVGEFSRAYGVEPKRVTPEALERLKTHRWPGNIRELQNVIERVFALSSEPEIGEKDLPPALLTSPPEGAPLDSLVDPMPFDQLERLNIAAALRKSGGNKNEAARILQIDRQRLYRKIEKYGIA